MDLLSFPSYTDYSVLLVLAETYVDVFQKAQQSLEDNNSKYKEITDKHRRQQVLEVSAEVTLYLIKKGYRWKVITR